MKLFEIIRDAKQELIERFDASEPYPEDAVHEIADSAVPVYNHDLITLAYNDMNLAVDVPELGPAFNGEPTPCNIIAANVYEAIANELYQLLYELQEQQEAA